MHLCSPKTEAVSNDGIYKNVPFSHIILPLTLKMWTAKRIKLRHLVTFITEFSTKQNGTILASWLLKHDETKNQNMWKADVFIDVRLSINRIKRS